MGLHLPRHSSKPAAKTGLVRKFAVLSLIPLVLLGLLLAQTLKGQIRARALEGAKRSAAVVARPGVPPRAPPGDLGHGLPKRRIRALNRALRSRLLGKDVAAIRVWSRKGRIVYADDPRLIGRTFRNNDELEHALHGHIESELFDPDQAHHDPTIRLWRRYGGLFEVYVPLVLGASHRPAGAFELYVPYRPIAAAIAHDTGRLYLMLGLGLLLLWLLLLPIAYRTAGVLRDQAAKLEGLLSRERQTVRTLQELDRMKTDFISVASHELRTPLTAILGFAKTLRHTQ